MRVHLLGLVHTETTAEYSWCAFTQKTRKLASMLTDAGHEVYLYAGEMNEARVTEHVSIIDREWQAGYFSAYNWDTMVFNDFHPDAPHWTDFHARAEAAIRERMQPGDILGITMGLTNKPLADRLPELLPVEVGIGYSGVWAPYRVFESYAWQHYLAGRYPPDDVRFFDAVIPNSFEVDEFPLGEGGDYFLFVGRFIRRKGIGIAVETSKRLGMPLLMAGQGIVHQEGNSFTGIDVTVEGDHLTHLGVLNPAQRGKIMGGAKAVFVPTQYLEPFGGVAVEAMLCGTPVITTDWGAFTETVHHGLDGFRCHTLAEFVRAGRDVNGLDRAAIRECAVSRFSTDVVKHQYDAYLRRLATLSGEGWYAVPKETDHAVGRNLRRTSE